ncbi:hypothetical protein LX64_00848 [Chitinophaga skermanii]|uniref:Uncharacterized protein n=1 Tax=Chitinophaga skermanii TaxID=331697 RepID=A0A327QV65_9BACT|nr:hypothetical protein LX64_00848 [Chitinophaga skermanii]
MQFGLTLNRAQMRAIAGGYSDGYIRCLRTLVDDCATQCPAECKCVNFVCFS